LSQTESLILSRPLGRRIAQIGDADAAGEPTFYRGFDQTWSDESVFVAFEITERRG